MIRGGREDLLAAGSATGSGVMWSGGDGAFLVYGTWDGATAKLQLTPDQGTTWIDVDGSTQTTDGGGPFDLPPVKHRLHIASAGASTSLSASLIGLE